MSSDSDQSDDPADGVRRTTDPAEARGVVEARGGYPGHEPRSEGQGDQGLLRIGRYGREEDLKEISWETFEEEFEENDLEYVYPGDESDPDAVDGDAGAGEIDVVGELRERSGR